MFNYNNTKITTNYYGWHQGQVTLEHHYEYIICPVICYKASCLTTLKYIKWYKIVFIKYNTDGIFSIHYTLFPFIKYYWFFIMHKIKLLKNKK